MTQKNNTKDFPVGFFSSFFPTVSGDPGGAPHFPYIFFLFSFFFFLINLTLN